MVLNTKIINTKLQYSEGETGIFYHGTTLSQWKQIQEEGILFGYRTHRPKEGQYRYTYLAPESDYANGYGNGEVLLEVIYKPIGVGVKINNKAIDNYGFNPPKGEICWQFSVFVPIDLKNVKRIK